MSKMSREYYDICEADGWQEEQSRDPDYEAISIDYSEKSWAEFSADLLNPDSPLLKQLNELCDVGVKDE
jgi:hypothetical protein